MLIGAVFAFLQLPQASHAEVYKWVDANGKTHYSDNKDQAGNAQVEQLKVQAPPEAPPTAPIPTWKQQEIEFKLRQAQQQTRVQASPPESRHPKSRNPNNPYYSNKPETDKSRCDLAHDIKSGAAVRSRGAPTDANDRRIADQDIQSYCH
ncbi:DUF4124 domain-containing protein [Oxalobacteraceae bacterium]|nr:DUF4124 domain-containing protein [Oxalobacteraceae bacterium]